MKLTKYALSKYLASKKINIPIDLENQILEKYGSYVIDDGGHFTEYTEQDISEQVRKIINNYQRGGEKKDDFLT